MQRRKLTVITVKTAVFATLVSMMGVGGLSGAACADYYKYTDGRGVVCITNSLGTVPPKYRATMKVIREETLAKKDKGAVKEASREASVLPEGAPQAAAPNNALSGEPTSFMGRMFARFPWSRPLCVVFAILMAFFLVRKLSSQVSSALLGRVIYLAFFLGIFVFAYKAYADHVTNSYFSIKNKILVMFEKSNRREMRDPADSPSPPPVAEQSDK